jgi:hypothetical protein
VTHPAPRQPYPWHANDLLRWFAMLGVAAVALVVAWWGASGTARTSTLITWINVGGAAIVVAGLANMRWLLQGRRAVAVRRRSLMPAALSMAPRSTVMRTANAPADDVRVAVAGTTRHHRPDCVAVTGKTVRRASVAAHERAGRRPCGLCDG